MQYFITGASGFIGRRLVKKLLAREDSTIYFLVRATEKESLANLYDFWECDAKRAIPVIGDLTEPLLGLLRSTAKNSGKKPRIFSTLPPSMISQPLPISSSRSMLRARATRSSLPRKSVPNISICSARLLRPACSKASSVKTCSRRPRDWITRISRPSTIRKASFAASAVFPGASTAQPLLLAIRALAKWTRSTALIISSN